MNPDEIIFALDIGTRTVIGIVGVFENGKFNILESESVEHKSRAMLDGQVHDIEAVADAANEVKCALEEKTGLRLNKVAIAAAGRVLKTKQIKIERQVDQGTEITSEIIESLEMEGIQSAQYELEKDMDEADKTLYYCVGYSIVNYYLNNYVIASLLGHKGKSIGADVLATFLPHTVVDSLYTVVKKINLEVVNLTLEPIAAINVAIPKDLRMLNLALVDIGAGTSDIAITRDGSVVAYGMAPVAGDEITELICHEYLIDFNTAEKIKLSLNSKSAVVKFTDIMGIKRSIKKEDIRKVIEPAVNQLAETISNKILEFNQKSTNAVFLVGGGSQICGLASKIAEKLSLPKERVAVRERNIIQGINVKGKKLSGPESITPIGIAVTALMQQGRDFYYVNVNNQRVRLFNSRKLKVVDALVTVGIKPEELIGRSGKSLGFIFNGEKKTIKGDVGTSAVILVNEKEANLQTELNPWDNITVTPAAEGKAAAITISEIIEYYGLGDVKIKVNGHDVSQDYSICQDDEVIVEYQMKHSLKEQLETSNDLGKEAALSVEVPEYKAALDSEVPEDKAALGSEVPEDKAALDSEILEYKAALDTSVSVENVDKIKVTVNKKEVIIDKEGKDSIFVDVFKYIDFDPSMGKGGNIILKLNGVNAAYTDILNDGDVIEIYCDK